MKYQDLSQLLLLLGFRGSYWSKIHGFGLIQNTLFDISPEFMSGWRNFTPHLFGVKFGKDVIILSTNKITYLRKLFMSYYSWVGNDVDLYALAQIEIVNNTLISQKAYFFTVSPEYDEYQLSIRVQRTTIIDECWLAAFVYVLSSRQNDFLMEI